MDYIDMFCGIGGFRLGLEKCNNDKIEKTSSSFKCVWANDINKYACQIYRKHFGKKELIEGDIRTINPDSIPNFDLLTAGFPCQSFSLAGERKGFQDIRGTLFFEIIRIAETKRPKLLLLENVKGLLSNDKGKTFGTILEELGNIGYWVEWQTLNSKYHGIPQNRERVFIIGHLRSASTRQIFPIGTDDSSDEELGKKAEGRRKGVSTNDILPTLRGGEKWSTFISPQVQPLAYLGRNQKNFDNDIMLCLDGRQSTGLREGQRIRRLTPTEYERFQGFPDGWTVGLSDSRRYKLLGNAVTVNVIQFLGENIHV